MCIHKWRKHAVFTPGASSRWTLEVHVYPGVGRGFYEVCASGCSDRAGQPQQARTRARSTPTRTLLLEFVLVYSRGTTKISVRMLQLAVIC